MTPTTPEQARGIAAHMMQTSPLYVAYMSLADQVEALTKERDAAMTSKDKFFDESVKHRQERDALTLGIDQWRVDYHELRLERDTLAAAAKLALDLINDLEPLYWDTNKDKRRHTDAVAALREALK